MGNLGSPGSTGSSSADHGDGSRFWRPPGSAPPCPRCGGTGYVRRNVPVGHEAFGRAVPCECAERDAAEQLAEQLQRMSNLGPLAGQRLSDEALQANADLRTACQFADELTPQRWLVLSGPAGSGRTRLAAELANRRLERAARALYFVAADLLDRLRAAYRRDAQMPYPVLFEHARDAEFLIIDDADLTNPTDWAREKLFQLLNHRWNAGLRTVIIVGESGSDGLGLARWLATGDRTLNITLRSGRATSRYHQIGGLREDVLARYTFDRFRARNGEDLPSDACNLKLIKSAVADWAAAPRGSLTLIGGTGTGKTHLAAAVANLALDRGEEVWFAVVPDLLDVLRRTYRTDVEETYDELFASLQDAPLLILDDFGAHSPTPWAVEKLYQLCAGRYVAERPTMFTTNVMPDNLDPRVASRLLDQRVGKVFEIVAPDYRTEMTAPSQPPAQRRRGRRPANGGFR